jgi:uncharacterized protein (DUF952 family)
VPDIPAVPDGLTVLRLSSPELIYHCSLVADWQAAQAVGEYTVSSRGRTLEQEGFVHASYAGQIAGVLQRFYADVTEPMCVLTIDPDKLAVPVVAENLTGGQEPFPHIYGAVPVSAVVEVAALVRNAAGWRSPVG